MKKIFIRIVKRGFSFYVTHFPIKINDYWLYMSSHNIELVPNMLRGKYETGMTKLIKRIVKKGFVICDVGAYIGYHTTLFSKLSGKSGKIYDFEPQPFHYELLLKNIKLNKLKNVNPQKTAISDHSGIGNIYIPDENSPDSRIYKVKGEKRLTSKIKLETIDNLLKNEKKIDIIKMDVQGWEEFAIKGATKTIRKNPELFLIIEFWPKGLKEAGTDPFRLLTNIEKYGFKIYTIHEITGKLKLETSFSQLIKNTERGDGGYVDLLCFKKHIRPYFKN